MGPDAGPGRLEFRVGNGGTTTARPFAMSASYDGVILTWHDVRNAPDAGDIYAQKLNSAGIPGRSVTAAP